MSRSVLAQSVAILLEDEEHESNSSRRFIDLCISLRLCDVNPNTTEWDLSTDEELIRVGGRWDKRAKAWSNIDPSKMIIARVHRGQEMAARYLAEWFSRRALGPSGIQWESFRRLWTLLFFGGRRSGKSHLACVGLAMFAVMIPRSKVWAISPTQEETDELEQALRQVLPRKWFKWRGGGAGKAAQFKLLNGSRIFLLSGYKSKGLKRGGVDLALYNEAQNMNQSGWIQLRGAIADTGGMVILASNPPDAPIGRWIEDLYERAKAKTVKAEVFEMSAEANPFVEIQALRDMADEVDELTYRREVLGELVPIGDVVMHAWSNSQSIRHLPDNFIDITREFTKAALHRSFSYLVGMDFQRLPHMAASILKVFIDPADENKTPLLWIVDEAVVENSDEQGLVLELESKEKWTAAGWVDGGYSGDECAVIADASGDWQDTERKRGSTSFDHLKAEGWKYIYKPDKRSQKNPQITDRCKTANARLKSASGVRRMFSLAHNKQTNRALRLWENRNGVAYRRSEHAHICDAVTYVVYRFFGRPKKKRTVRGEYRPVVRQGRSKMMRSL